MIPQASINRTWAWLTLETLARHQVEHVCVAPGSRSTPLTLEADLHPKLTLHSHYDERGLGFYALGLAKASRRPVAIVVTSGTAVANLLPAVAEAKLTGEKLILLTADRPQTLIDCGANQAIEQRDIFSHHVNWQVALPSPSENITPNWLLTTLEQGLSVQAQRHGAIHINCAFPEPLYGEEKLAQTSDYLAPIASWLDEDSHWCQLNQSDIAPSALPTNIWHSKGVIVIGQVSLAQAKRAKRFAQQLGWPCLCDPQSGVSSPWQHYDLWLKNSELATQLGQAELVVQFGARLVSKRFSQWFECHQSHLEWVLVDANPSRLNPSHLQQQRFIDCAIHWIESQQLPELPLQAKWNDASLPAIEWCKTQIQSLSFEKTQEVTLARDIDTWLAPDVDLFIGNSLIVRLVDMLGALSAREVFTNRGASGIDGLVATASGVQQSRSKPMVMLIGDTSLLHDINSLALMRNVSQPVVIIVVNNDGGAIFDMLPVPEQKRSALYQMPHAMTFEHAAMQFQLGYQAPNTLVETEQVVVNHINSGSGTLVVEVLTEPQSASKHLKQLSQTIEQYVQHPLA
ncbi:2-succinyl-5-enolpyruvyl-6-hydroxy-3-cyclohexene-1-carboxylic-acid synthase [Vibrio sp. SCSIO 43136]|uniref:2-succinyl-5-enolpyruvyl-6-hydroxy-3- cyclohexene-1-carboxylic-acid synthase n=1 Tax=Vibrio sp. SCSIO 43136 TaxID=2819101 RepID=UPI0020765CE7|nr:2-succinyl-5-enolpyruvyl-6-hydroxy-3-cyclohexene-1-carboxylic-acid synthase [Vibrio sp. SCSIO 43136]USD64459.1 2-succinyl-5-enolpyruvyl-6-hydroxy-3-cyclohexene-1-carboxylic-acid synthase [Vibrio sp. SCSIO 43136]